MGQIVVGGDTGLEENCELFFYHGSSKGPENLINTLEEINTFMEDHTQELIILKFSHFKEGFTSDMYKHMVDVIVGTLDELLVKNLPDSKRLADITFSKLVGKIIVVCDGNFPIDIPKKGIWVYRDWFAEDPQNGDLCIFDRYSDSDCFDDMKDDQLDKFKCYNGKCLIKTDSVCDLFLLSWPLTTTDNKPVREPAKLAGSYLGKEMAKLPVPNKYGCVPNLLYVDYAEYARVTGVAIKMNLEISKISDEGGSKS